MEKYTGYIYIWWDTLENLYYIGGHQGRVEDSYICSNTMLRGIFNRRPETLRFRVLEYVCGTTSDLRHREQYWLNFIGPEETYLGKTPRYFNMKVTSTGGNGNANKGNSNIGGHNRVSWKIITPSGDEIVTNKLQEYCNDHGLSKSTLYSSFKDNGRTILRGPCKGYRLEKL